MEHVFEKVIAIEHRAKEVYEEAVTRSQQMKQELQQDILQRGNEIREMAEGKIRQLIASGKRDVEEKLERINHQIQEKLQRLEAEALENTQKWEDLVFSRITGD